MLEQESVFEVRNLRTTFVVNTACKVRGWTGRPGPFAESRELIQNCSTGGRILLVGGGSGKAEGYAGRYFRVYVLARLSRILHAWMGGLVAHPLRWG